MRRIAAGGFISLCGAFILAAIIITAGIYAASLASWSGYSKFWYVIFGAPAFGEVNLSLNLGIPFVVSLILLSAGIAIMIVDLFRK